MQSVFVKRVIVIGLVGMAAIVISYLFENSAACSIKQANLQIDIQKYETSSDPEACDDINNRIIHLDNQCKIDLEILDCG